MEGTNDIYLTPPPPQKKKKKKKKKKKIFVTILTQIGWDFRHNADNYSFKILKHIKIDL